MRKYLVSFQKPDRSVIGISWSSNCEETKTPESLLNSLDCSEKIHNFLAQHQDQGATTHSFPNRNAFIDASCSTEYDAGYIFVLGRWLYCDEKQFLPI